MKKILLIEDDEVLADILAKKLIAAGYEAELIKDGAQGYERILSWKPDLILLDVFLPTLNGIEILNKKREDKSISDIPVLVLSNSLHPTRGTELEKIGATAFMVKSDIQPEKVISIIKKTLGEDIASTNSLSGKRILLVEDDSFLGSILLSRLLDKEGVVTLTKTGEEALEYLKRQAPDVVLLDILLPGMNGFEVLESIRSNPATKDLPVIVISNFNQPKDQERAQQLGAGLLVKALVDPDIIADTIEKMLVK